MIFRLFATALSVALSLAAPAAIAAAPLTAPAPAPMSHPDVIAAAKDGEVVTSVMVISVDGLTPLALQKLGRSGTPHLHEFMDSGASTLNARTQYEMTLTLPNHTGMVTGRRITATRGGHGVTWNDDRRRPRTVQAAARARVESVFTSLHRAGLESAVFANKTKFSLWKRSWPTAIDRSTIHLNPNRVVQAAVKDLSQDRALRFVHIGLPDAAAHASGFMSGPYLNSVRRADHLVGKLVAAVQGDEDLRDSTAIILTSDHGGTPGSTRHSDHTRLANYRIPFMVRGPGIPAGADLYALNDDYADPEGRRIGYEAQLQPIRNTAVANLALDLLGLDAVPGSELNRRQDLEVG